MNNGYESLEVKLTVLLNKESAENESNTPDHILAQYLLACLAAFNTAVQQRETWYGRDARPSETT
jgi:hypothetical protein